jgi:hypothetical protein
MYLIGPLEPIVYIYLGDVHNWAPGGSLGTFSWEMYTVGPLEVDCVHLALRCTPLGTWRSIVYIYLGHVHNWAVGGQLCTFSFEMYTTGPLEVNCVHLPDWAPGGQFCKFSW